MKLSKTQIEFLAAAILVSALAYKILERFIPAKTSSSQAQAMIPPALTEQLSRDTQFVSDMRVADKSFTDQEDRWSLPWERDPFEAAGGHASTSIENLILQGVFWDDVSPQASVNGKMVKSGESIDGYKIVEIRPSSVVLWTGEKNMELSVFRSPLQPPPGLSDSEVELTAEVKQEKDS